MNLNKCPDCILDKTQQKLETLKNERETLELFIGGGNFAMLV